MKEVFAQQLADRSLVGRKKLAAELLVQADKSADNVSDQFVVFAGAIEAAKEACDVRLCIDAADAMGRVFDVDALAVKADAIAKIKPKAPSVASSAESVQLSLAVLDQLLAVDDYPSATRVVDSLTALPLSDAEAKKAIQQRSKDLNYQKLAHERFVQQSEKLRTSPTDHVASQGVGSWYCFIKDDWKTGLRYLAEADSSLVKAAAKADLASPQSADAKVAAGHAWWTAADADTGPNQTAMRSRAAGWYASALQSGQVTGLSRALLQKRIDLVPKFKLLGDGITIAAEGDSGRRWISAFATYSLSSQDADKPPLPNLLDGRGGGYQGDGFAFHTKTEDQPYVVIDLGISSTIQSIEIANRQDQKENPGHRERAKTLTAWVANDSAGPWKEVWRAPDVQFVWTATLASPATGRYVKLGLRERNPLHLYSVKVFGSNARSLASKAGPARPVLIFGQFKPAMPALTQIGGGHVKVVNRAEAAQTMATPNAFAGMSIAVWINNVWRDQKPEDFTPEGLSAMQTFVRDGGDLIMFEQFAAGNMKIFEQTFGIRTLGSSNGKVTDAELKSKAEAAGISPDRLAKVPVFNRYEKLPPGSRVLMTAPSDEAVGVIAPYGKGRLILLATTLDKEVLDLDETILDLIYHYKEPSTPAR